MLLLPYLQQAQTDTEKFRVCLSISDVWHARIGTVAKSFSKALQRPPLGTVTARRRREDSPGYSTSTTPSAWRPASIFSSLWQSPTSNVGDDSQDTIRAGQHSDGEEEEEGEGTLKGLEPNAAKAPPSARSVVPSRGNTRLSSLFDAWSYSTHSPEATESKESLKSSIGRNRMVSEPMAMDDFRRASMLNLDTILLDAKKQDAEDAALVGIDVQFENMMDQLGIKENQRQAMRMMDDQRKRFLIQQQQQKTGSAVQQVQSHKSGLARTSSNRQSASNNTPPTSALAGLTRFSLWSAGTDSSASEPNSRPQSPEAPRSPGISDTASVLSFVSQDTEVHTPPAPLLQTATGWSSWFSAGSPAKPSIALTDQSGTSNAKDTPSFYITQIMNGKLARPNLVKHLIALRVRLSTAALSWITDFLQNDGLAALEKILRTFTSRTTTATGRDSLTELNASLQIETIRCLRIILNTEVSYPRQPESLPRLKHIAPIEWFRTSAGQAKYRHASHIQSSNPVKQTSSLGCRCSSGRVRSVDV